MAGLVGFLVSLLLAGFCAWRGYQAETSETRPIESLQPGQRMLVDAPAAALAADHHRTAKPVLEDIDPDTWKLIRLQAEDRWPDGTVDVVEVNALQPPEWLEAHNARIGARVPLPLDLVEMGLSQELRAVVVGIEQCPDIEDGDGRIVLTTVSHLHPHVLELTLQDADGNEETLCPTATHKFYSVTRDGWLHASELQPGEQLSGVSGEVTLINTTRLPGVHRVYNLTVQGEHLYRVGHSGVLVHNTCPEIVSKIDLPDGRSIDLNARRGVPTNVGPYSSKAPRNVTPGIRELEGHYVDDLGRVQPWRAHYDDYGRLIGRTDYSAGNRAAGIPDIHYERWEYNAQYPLGRKFENHMPGEFPE